MARFLSLEDWLNWQEQLHPRPIDLGLERVANVFRQLNLGRKKNLTITVAGTNGKGSCVAYLEANYLAQGYRVGAYTSPHILRYNERIRINGQAVADELICAAFERIDQLRLTTSLSYFEFSTLAALAIFANAELDIQILEVGLGGRLDAVNIVDADVGIVSTIGLDHIEWLGDNLEQIAVEKAGIFRKDAAAIIGDYQPPQSLIAVAEQKQAKLMAIGKQFDYQKKPDGSWNWSSAGQDILGLPAPALKGEHQYRNAAAVLMAVQFLQSQLAVSDRAICQGLEQVELKGRFQLIADKIPVLLDVGHNPQAVQTLIEYLQAYYPSVKIHAVFAMMKDKDIDGVLKLMQPYVAEWYLAPLALPRAANDALLIEKFQQQAIHNLHCGYRDFSAAFSAAQDNADEGELILVFGSFFLVSEYLAKLT